MRTPTRCIAVRSLAVSLLPLVVLAAFAIALAFAPSAARGADEDDKDWTILGETSIKDAKDAAKDAGGGGGKDRKRGEKDGEKKREGEKKAEAGTAAGEIDVRAALVKRIKFEVRGAEVEFKKITVTYESGDPEEIEVRKRITGHSSLSIRSDPVCSSNQE